MLRRGQDFHSEKAIISIELYRKGVWRFAAVANGFNGGLGDLLRSYGGEELTAPPQPPPAENRKNIPEERAKGIPEQKQRHPNHP